MTAAMTTLHQTALMLLLLGIGVICARLGWFDERAAQALSRFLLWFVTPALLLDAFYRPFCADMAVGLVLSALLAVLFHAAAALVSALLLRPSRPQYAVARMGVVYSNCGFMAFPLISAVAGEQGIFYASAFVGVFNLFLWTHGQRLLAGRQAFRLKNAVCNAGVLGTIAGAALYFLQIPLPALAVDLIDTLASLNTPLAMLVIGMLLAGCRMKELLCRRVLLPSLLRMVVLPLLLWALLLVLRVADWGAAGQMLFLVTLLCASCPSAASTVLMSAAMGKDSAYGARLVLCSSLLSVATIPAAAYLASFALR